MTDQPTEGRPPPTPSPEQPEPPGPPRPPHPPAGTADDESERADPTVQRKAGTNEIVIAVAGVAAFVGTFLSWVTHDFGGWSNAWSTGAWPAGTLALAAALVHLIRMLPPADKAFGALLPLLLSTAAVWIPVAALPGNGDAWGVWLCLAAGIVLTGALLVAALSDEALRRADDPDDFFN